MAKRSALLAAVKKGDLAKVRQLVEAGEALDATDAQGLGALDLALAGGHDEVGAALVEAGAPCTPEHLAEACRVDLPQIAHAAIARGVDPNGEAFGHGALRFAIRSPALFEALLEAGADPERSDEQGGRAIDDLLEDGAPKQRLKDGAWVVELVYEGPEHEAIAARNAAARAVLARSRPDLVPGVAPKSAPPPEVIPRFAGIVAPDRDVALRIAASNSMLHEVRTLLKEGADPGPALGTAAGLGLTRVVGELLKHGVAVDARDDMDLTPLMSACSSGGAKGSRVAMMLIEAGADVTAVREADQMTALAFAVGECKPEVIEALLAAGAPVDGPDGADLTPLMLAARANDAKACEILVAHGARLDRPCRLPWADGKTARELAELEGCAKAAKYLASVE